MLQNVTTGPSRRTLEFGIYRDGDNNLDRIQSAVIDQAVATSRSDSRIAFAVEDTTARHGTLHTDGFSIADGAMGHVTSEKPHDMSDELNLARFVARTLDESEANGASQTWIDLVDHGGGDGGGLQTHDGSCMSMPDIAKAIQDGVAMHVLTHPEDLERRVDGVVANQCLMDTMGFADALSRAHVKWLAASPETMLAPGVPTGVAHDIAEHQNDSVAMAKAVVSDVMNSRYGFAFGDSIRPAAAFDVLDLDAAKIANAEKAIRAFNDDASGRAKSTHVRAALRADVRATSGMTRFAGGKDLPWRADRPAIAVYDTIARDERLAAPLRAEAGAARDAIGNLVLASRESAAFGAFGGSDYTDAKGPTMHFPLSRAQIDPWSENGMTETHNAFYDAVDQGKFVAAIA